MDKDFRNLQAELEEIIVWFESPDATIDEAADKYERGLEIARQLKKRLSEVENTVTKLKQKFSE